ncbi:DUF7230 family protein [Paludibacterium purpuratum]|uniref:Uncharacterized protein n=1 Tax=Paludibacterium purpuratum TaxID=1144873 RepID=A0A4R7AZM6_9NEIS|nr:hypothetical protein [Paludibacterium purpuratum]TDR73895.1 hypothetical protein DFP86_11299 [Paludibacterium purpuratum]
MSKKQQRTNPVAKFAQQFQRCSAFADRKKRQRQGYSKHKKAEVFILPPFILSTVRVLRAQTCGSLLKGVGQ